MIEIKESHSNNNNRYNRDVIENIIEIESILNKSVRNYKSILLFTMLLSFLLVKDNLIVIKKVKSL